MYDMKAEKEIAGTLTMIKFVNPHGSLTITVKTPTARRSTGRSRPARQRRPQSADQQSRTECAQGRRTVDREVHPGTEREFVGVLKSITRADGTVMNISAGNPND
jgi:hypothetical protein